MNDHELRHLRYAYMVAQGSKDPSTQNGAVLVDPETDKVVAWEYNRFPFLVNETAERWERPEKYKFVEHAERGAIYRAAMTGVKTFGLHMYCPWFACTDCARAIIQSGISKVIGHALPEHADNPRWKDSIKDAMTMLDEAGIKYYNVSGKIGCAPIRMDGKLVHP